MGTHIVGLIFLNRQSLPAIPASECLDWSPVNVFALPLLTDEHQQSAKVLQKFRDSTTAHTAWIALKRFTAVE
nr:hypothetical protein [uncultured Pedobacter sp.]